MFYNQCKNEFPEIIRFYGIAFEIHNILGVVRTRIMLITNFQFFCFKPR